MALRIALSGFAVLVVAMGIGRFAFTPQVPLMIAAGQLTLTSAGLVAAMNYLGYLVGAWDAMRAHRFVETRLWLGITGAVALTLLLRGGRECRCSRSAALCDRLHERLVDGADCRLDQRAAGAAGQTGTQCGRLCRTRGRHRPERPAGGLYSGEILVRRGGMANLRRTGAGADRTGGALPAARRSASSPGTAPEPLLLTADLRRLVWSYSLAGFGYILPATFLSQMAAVRFPGSLFAQFVWPIFGAASVVGIALSIALRHTSSANRRLAIVLWLQGIGVLAAGCCRA